MDDYELDSLYCPVCGAALITFNWNDYCESCGWPDVDTVGDEDEYPRRDDEFEGN